MNRPCLSASVVMCPDERGYLAYDARGGRLHQLNAIASLIVELCDGRRSSAEVCELAEKLLGVEGRAACMAWMDQSLRDGLLVDAARDPSSNAVDRTAAELSELAWVLQDDDHVLSAYVCQWGAAERDPDCAQHWRRLGELAHLVGRRDVARDAYERYARVHLEDAEVALMLVALRGEPPPLRAPDESVVQIYEKFASFYESNMCDDLGYQAPALLEEAIAREFGGRDSLRVLDLGCGTGLAGRRLRGRAARLVGIDLSPAMIEKARVARLYDALEVGEITRWLDRPVVESFDLIMACDALIYFGDLFQVLVPAARWLAAGGMLAFTLEQGGVAPYQLTDAGRYAHHRDHIAAAVAAAGLMTRELREVVLRHEYGEEVKGWLVLAGAGP